MQKTTPMMDYVLLPIPFEVAEELALDPFTTIQYTVSRGRLIIEPVDPELSMTCFGICRRCSDDTSCEGICR